MKLILLSVLTFSAVINFCGFYLQNQKLDALKLDMELILAQRYECEDIKEMK